MVVEACAANKPHYDQATKWSKFGSLIVDA